MSWDEELAACSRRCAASDAPLAPGQSYYSVVLPENGQLVRRDFAAEAWQGPPEGAVAWWKATAPQAVTAPRLAPEDMLLQLFERLAGSPEERELRYLLGLLLLRKRLLRFVEARHDPDGAEWWGMEALRTETQYELLVAAPAPELAAELQQRLLDLVYGSSAKAPSPAVAMQTAKEAA